MSVRFAMLGGRPDALSKLGHQTIAALLAAGGELAAWIEGGPEPEMPGSMHDPAPLGFEPPRYTQATPVDVVIQLDESAPPLSLLRATRLGVWRFATASPGPLAFWDVYDGLYHAEIRLEGLTEDPARTVPLERRYIAIDRYSYANSLRNLTDEMAQMPAYVLRCGPASQEALVFPPQRIDPPSRLDLLRLRARIVARQIRHQTEGILFAEAWRLGVLEGPAERFLSLGYIENIDWLPSPRGRRFLADPFLAATSQGLLLAAEEFNYATGRGKIVHELSADGRFTGHFRDGIAEAVHFSYPFLLEDDGEIYCIPETHERNGVFAWRWRGESQRWEEAFPLLEGIPALDPTPVCFENRWWLFLTRKDDGPDSKLHLYYADRLAGPWLPHARNPVKVDVRGSRPGGTPFIYHGALYRPAQDSSKHYGWRLAINHVVRITPTEFVEDVARVFESARLGLKGIHTLSSAGGKTIVDGRRERFAPWRIPRLLAHKLRRLADRR